MAKDIAKRPVRTVIVDDTRTIRAMIRAMLSRSPMIEVVGEAADPWEAREVIRELNPDVITLDVVMPGMDGLSFLERLMRLHPMPVVMVSTRTTEKSAEAVTALSLGAFDCVDIALLNKGGTDTDLADIVVAAAASNTRGLTERRQSPDPSPAARLDWNGRVVVIGSSTGGVDALLTVLSEYPADGPPTVIAQHMPKSYLASFTARLEKTVAPHVALAEDDAPLRPGHVYLAPGGDYHAILGAGRRPVLKLARDEGVETYVPSVNVLFSSAVPHGNRIVGVLLTGMGRDGAAALLEMRKAGAHTIVQDGASAVVDGMPRAARELDAAVEVASLSTIGQRILANVVKFERKGVK